MNEHCTTPDELRYFDEQAGTAKVGVAEVLEAVDWLIERGFVGEDFKAALMEVANG